MSTPIEITGLRDAPEALVYYCLSFGLPTAPYAWDAHLIKKEALNHGYAFTDQGYSTMLRMYKRWWKRKTTRQPHLSRQQIWDLEYPNGCPPCEWHPPSPLITRATLCRPSGRPASSSTHLPSNHLPFTHITSTHLPSILAS
jgi:hypothetical protein